MDLNGRLSRLEAAAQQGMTGACAGCGGQHVADVPSLLRLVDEPACSCRCCAHVREDPFMQALRDFGRRWAA
jgi:hypothetical protein